MNKNIQYSFKRMEVCNPKLISYRVFNCGSNSFNISVIDRSMNQCPVRKVISNRKIGPQGPFNKYIYFEQRKETNTTLLKLN